MRSSVTGLASTEVQPTSSVSAPSSKHYVFFERPAAPAAGTEKHQKKKSGLARAAAARASVVWAWASVVWLSPVRSSGGMSPFLSGLDGRGSKPRKEAEEGPDGSTEYGRIMETRFWM